MDHINPFLLATSKILKEMCFIEPKMDKPSIKRSSLSSQYTFNNNWITGKIKGQVIIAFEHNTACDIALK